MIPLKLTDKIYTAVLYKECIANCIFLIEIMCTHFKVRIKQDGAKGNHFNDEWNDSIWAMSLYRKPFRYIFFSIEGIQMISMCTIFIINYLYGPKKVLYSGSKY